MNKKDFFVALLSDCASNEEKAVRLLQLLGYFIHSVDGEYYLSDNAALGDDRTLEEIINAYSLGEVRRQIPPRVIYEKKKSNFYTPDKSIMDLSFSVSEDCVISVIEECFKSVRLGLEAGSVSTEWWKYIIGKMPKKVPVSSLEPFIAYYVKAISACGVATCYSCDGNHLNGGKIICQSDYPSSIFHKRIWSDVCNKFDIEGDIEKGILFDEDSQYDLYYKIYKAANYLYENRINYRNMKYWAIHKLRDYKNMMKKYKAKPTDEQYEEWFCKEIDSIK